ncbi:TIGR01841 family phasin [Paraburkholderia sp. RL17-373-BIF-A]|uniref:TIGR01841 family phasin n=1 Tax=Paraburkholderia sp. RL17-373-BIF-A TaxID=3031629 RepID=UPI0038B7171F
MAQIIPEQWLGMETNGFDQLFGITTRCCDAFERLTALNLQAVRFGLAETQEALARTFAADNLPELLCLPTLLAPVGFAQALAYSRQFFQIMSNLHRDSTPPQPVGTVRQRHLADSLIGSLATQSLVPCDVLAEPAMSSTSPAPAAENAATATTKRGKRGADNRRIQPMHTE